MICDYVSELPEQFQQWRRHGFHCTHIPLLSDDDCFSVADVYFSDSGFLCCVPQRIPRVGIIAKHYHHVDSVVYVSYVNLSVTVNVTVVKYLKLNSLSVNFC